MPQLVLFLAIIVFFSPSIFQFLGDSNPRFFSGSTLGPLVAKGVTAYGKKDIVVVQDMASGVFSLGLGTQNITDVTGFAFDPEHQDAIFAATREGDLLYKYGESPWFVLEGSAFLRLHAYMVRKILFDSADPSIFYMLVSNHKEHGIVYSRNRGQSIEMLYALSREEQIVDIGPIPGESGALLAGTEKGLLISSDDYGASWAHVASFTSPIVSFVISESDPSSLFVVTSDGLLYISDNRGVDFRLISVPGGGLVKKIALGNKKSNFFAMTGQDVYKTNDGGANFEKVLIPVTVKDQLLSDFALSPSNGQILYVAFGTLLLKSKDGGVHWNVKNIDAKSIDELKISPFDGETAYVKVTY